MNLIRRDTNLGTQTVFKPSAKPLKHSPSRWPNRHHAETPGRSQLSGDNGIGMTATMMVNVFDGLLNRINHDSS